MAKNKFKVNITSDGTVAGTVVKVNGEEVTKVKNVTNVNFYASGGVKWNDDDKMSPYISFGYDVLNKNDDGSEAGESYNFRPNGTVERGTIGKKPEKQSDLLVGRDPEVVDAILSYAEKAKRYIPDRETLLGRSQDSLQDLLDDLKKECDE